ncbi:MAG: S8 family peptidase [Bacteroidota bacterium]
MRKFVFGAVGLLMTFSLAAQMEAPENWWNLDREADNYPGVSANRVHDFLQGKQAQKVVVAVIDSGIDIEHEDLADIIWTNEDEIPGNNRDDDNNGYIDDINGWNFIGGPGGTHINHENLEITRIYTRLSQKYANRNPDGLPKAELAEYRMMEELGRKIDEERAAVEPQAAQLEGLLGALNSAVEAMNKSADEITVEDIDAFEPADEMTGQILGFARRVMVDEGMSMSDLIGEIEGGMEQVTGTLNYYYNTEYDARHIVGDDPSNLDDRNYGNNSVEGPEASHGTHVAGIIAAVRGNGIGVDGVGGANIEIMVVRAVPDGDERDKDVANAIRYAVDNGASVINMSFGKSHSPYKGAVDDAVKYAEKNDVVVVHAAGNDGKELNLTNNYPNDTYLRPGFLRPGSSRTYITVGASSANYDEQFPARFSNYHREMVDVFAPGHRIYSTFPDDEYNAISGTSMAAPMVAGIAGLLRSYFPDLTARQVREIILESAVPVNLEVRLPGTEDEMVPFSRLSATGGMANAYTAVMLAQQTKGKKRRTVDRDPSLVGY